MQKAFYTILLLIISGSGLHAQIFPKEAAVLYYRIIGFSFPAEAGATKYTLQIAAGNYDTDALFEKNIVASASGKTNKIVAEVPSFGAQYTWRIVPVSAKKSSANRSLHHFSTRAATIVDTTVARLRIMKNTGKYKDHYIFIDGTKTLYDMKGNPVWFLPGADVKANQNVYPRDLKMTPQGSITFHTNTKPYEISYSGDILWYYNPGKTGQKTPSFHHEFTRLQNGHYMGLIYESTTGNIPPVVRDSIIRDTYDSAGYYHSRLYNSIVEYDENCREIWHWSGLQYINSSDLARRRSADVPVLDHDLHENSFFFDEKNKTVYLSLRNISRIIKIKYPEGNVLNTYGTIYTPGTTSMENDLFCFQHCCRRSANGYLYLYNNNTCGADHLPTIEVLQEPAPGGTALKKIWEYKCTLDGMDNGDQKMVFHAGGCVSEMPDRSFLVQMGKPYPKTFIVTRDKHEVWSAIPETYDPATKKWLPYTDLYNACIISRKELEQLIWNSEKK